MVAPRHFGILVPSTNTTCEIEFCRLPPELQVHIARLGKGGSTPFSPSLDSDISRIDRPDIDALMVPGGNFPTMDWIAPWERQFGKPVITTNQATLWVMLRAMAIDTPLAGKGRLLEQMPVG